MNLTTKPRRSNSINNAVPDSIADALYFASDHLPVMLHLAYPVGSNTRVQFGTSTMTVNEDFGMVDISVTITNPDSVFLTTVEINITGGSGTLNDLVNFIPATVVFPSGYSSVQTISIEIFNDEFYEGFETLVFSLHSINGGNQAAIGIPNQIVLTISDNDIPEIVINEIMINPNVVGDSYGEWLELVNIGNNQINLRNWLIKDSDTDHHLINTDLLIDVDDYIVLGNNTDPASNGGVVENYRYFNIQLANSNDELFLISPENIVIDSLEWGGVNLPVPHGASIALIDPWLNNSIGLNWEVSTEEFGGGDLGTPGKPNTVFLSGDVNGDGSLNILDVVITVNFIFYQTDFSYYQFLAIDLTHDGIININDIVDCSAHKIVGAYLDDKEKTVLINLAKSQDIWERRIAIIATFYQIKNNSFSAALNISKILLNDTEDLIHKAVGWIIE